MVRKYAEGTEVPISRSRDELERTLTRFGATTQGWLRDDEEKVVRLAFKRNGRGYRFTVKLQDAEGCRLTPTKQRRSDSVAMDLAEAENRRRFRSLANYVKAVMDATDTGIISAEEALLPYMMLPSGETVAEAVIPQLASGNYLVNLSKALVSGRER